MILKQALGQARRLLAVNNIADAFLEAELLLRHTLRIDRVQLYLDLNRELNPEQEESFWHLIKRRLKGEPSAYITGHREFYGLDFYVDSNVLIPRPESELLVDKAISLAQNRTISAIAEIGTGCGAIAVCLAIALPQTRIYAMDISARALQVAEMNCRRYAVGSQVQLLQGNLLEPLSQPVDMIVANLPYIKDCEFKDLSPDIMNFEPISALAGGLDGLDKMQLMLGQIPGKLNYGGCFLLEIGKGQGSRVTSLIRGCFPKASIELISDLGGIERVVKVGL